MHGAKTRRPPAIARAILRSIIGSGVELEIDLDDIVRAVTVQDRKGQG